MIVIAVAVVYYFGGMEVEEEVCIFNWDGEELDDVFCKREKRNEKMRYDGVSQLQHAYNIENTNRFSLPLCIAICLPIAKLGITKRVIHLSTATNKMTPRNE